MANPIGQDSVLFRGRGNLATTNANLYIANNNNPFLVSPYSPPTVAATKATINTLSSLISSQIGNLSSVIDLNNYTLSISTIQPVPSDASQALTLRASTIYLDAGTDVQIPGVIQFNTMLGNAITTNDLTVNSAMTATGPITFTTLSGSAITASTFLAPNYVSTKKLVFSSLIMQPSSIVTFTTSTFYSSIIINVGGTNFHLPIFPV